MSRKRKLDATLDPPSQSKNGSEASSNDGKSTKKIKTKKKVDKSALEVSIEFHPTEHDH